MGERLKRNLLKMEEKALSEEDGGKPAEKTVEELRIELDETKAALKEANAKIEGLSKQLKVANDVLEAQTKSKLIQEIKPMSYFTVEDLSQKSIEELQTMRNVLTYSKGVSKNIRVGSASQEDEGPRLTVGDLSVVTAERRKRMGM